MHSFRSGNEILKKKIGRTLHNTQGCLASPMMYIYMYVCDFVSNPDVIDRTTKQSNTSDVKALQKKSDLGKRR